MIQVNTPDGGVAQFPDDTPPDIMRNALRAKFGGGPAKGVGDQIKGYAKQLALGATEGLEAVAPIAAAPAFGPVASQFVQRGVENLNKSSGQFTPPSGTGEEFARTTGQFVGNPASYIGGGSVGVKVLQAISSAIGSEGLRQLVKGTGPVAEGVASIVGAVIGGKAPSVAGRVVTPVPINDAKQLASVNELRGAGVEPTAGDVTGSKALRRAESSLGEAPFSGGAYTREQNRVGHEFTDALTREMGESDKSADVDLSTTINNARNRLSKSFEDTAKKLPINHDKKLGDDLVSISGDLLKEGLPDDTVRMIQKQIDNVQDGFVTGRGKGGQMSGKTYQALTRKNTPLDRAIDSNDPNVSYYATRIRTALDDAMERTATGQGTQPGKGRRAALDELKSARRQWYTMLVISKAASSAGEKAAHDIITPQRLRSLIANTDDNKIQYALQRSNLSRLSKAGNAVMSPLPNSNTAERSAILNPTVIGSAMGLSGRALMSKPVQGYLKNQKVGKLPASVFKSATVATINQLGGKQAPDGNYYIPDPKRPGKYLQVVPKRAQ